MQNGWIKLHRQIMENEIYQEERFSKAHAWIDLLLLSGHKERTVSIRNVTIQLKPGQLAYSQKTLADRWKWNRRTVKKFLQDLENRGMIHNRISKVTTVISINNWHKWQGDTQQENGAQQKIAEMHNRDAQQEIYEYGSNGLNMVNNSNGATQEKSTIFSETVHTNKNDNKQEAAAAADEKEFYQFVNKFVSACKNNGLFVNENVAVLKLKQAYNEFGFHQMRLCFNDVIDKALKKRENGERIRCVVTYGLRMLREDYKPVL